MADYPAMPLWTDAYLADTRHLTTAEHGAYLLLLMTAWRSPDCSLPDDDKFLGRAAGDPKHWRRLKPAVMAFWTLGEDGRWRQKRLLREREFVTRRSQLQSERAKARWSGAPQDGAESVPRNTDLMGACPPPNHLKSLHSSDAAANAAAMPPHPHSHPKVRKNGAADAAFDSGPDVALYRLGKAILGDGAGGQLTKLKQAVGGPGAALDVLQVARAKESPREYIAGVIRNRTAKKADPYKL